MNKLALSLPLLLCACGHQSGSVRGGALLPYAALKTRPDRVYAAATCRQKDGEPVRSPEGVEYEVRLPAQGIAKPAAPQLIEHSINEPDARIFENTWTEGSAQHYFVWLPDTRGFEYVIPQDRLAPAERRVYNRPVVQRVRGAAGSATRPLSQPDIICQMTVN